MTQHFAEQEPSDSTFPSAEEKQQKTAALLQGLVPDSSPIERENLIKLAARIGIVSWDSAPFDEPGLLNPLLDDTRYVETNDGVSKVFTPLWISYNSDTGRIESPPIAGESNTHSYVLLRFHEKPIEGADDSQKSIRQIELFDPTAEAHLELISAPQVEYSPSLPSGLPEIGGADIDPQQIMSSKINVFARRISAVSDSERREISLNWGKVSMLNVPFTPEKWGSRAGDQVLTDSIILLNVTALKLKQVVQNS